MERQLKERLIGAAVLVAAAVLLVPEMFSGEAQRERPPAAQDATSSEVSSGQIKTYRLDLKPAPGDAAMMDTSSSIDAPAPPPASSSSFDSDVAPATDAGDERAASVSSSSPAAVETSVPQPVAAPAIKPEPPVTKPAPVAKPAATSVTAKGQWVVQAGSFGTQARAEEIARTLSGGTLKMSVSPVKVGGKTLYRVRSNAFADRAAADRALQSIKGEFSGASVMPR